MGVCNRSNITLDRIALSGFTKKARSTNRAFCCGLHRSAGFNYVFKRGGDTIKHGVNIYLSH